MYLYNTKYAVVLPVSALYVLFIFIIPGFTVSSFSTHTPTFAGSAILKSDNSLSVLALYALYPYAKLFQAIFDSPVFSTYLGTLP